MTTSSLIFLAIVALATILNIVAVVDTNVK